MRVLRQRLLLGPVLILGLIGLIVLDQAIQRAAEYLVRVEGEGGRFEYRLFVDGRRGSKQKYNILRHAGSIYALADYRAATTEPAERALYAAMQQIVPRANAQFEAGEYTASLQTLAALREPVDAFFDGVMVNAEQMDVRLNRQALLKMLHQAMNRVADLSRLAV